MLGSGEAGLLLGTNSTLRAPFEGPVRPLERVGWIQQHRVAGTPEGFADRVMASIAERDVGRQQRFGAARLLLALGATRWGRCAVCLAALLVGMTPFAYVVYLANVVAF